MSPGVGGLAFIPCKFLNPTFYVVRFHNLRTMLRTVGVGTTVSGLVFLAYDRQLRRGKEQGATWAMDEEYRRLPLACIGGPMNVAALIWLVSCVFSHMKAWSNAEIH